MDFFFSGDALQVVFYTLLVVVIWIVWKLGFNRE